MKTVTWTTEGGRKVVVVVSLEVDQYGPRVQTRTTIDGKDLRVGCPQVLSPKLAAKYPDLGGRIEDLGVPCAAMAEIKAATAEIEASPEWAEAEARLQAAVARREAYWRARRRVEQTSARGY